MSSTPPRIPGAPRPLGPGDRVVRIPRRLTTRQRVDVRGIRPRPLRPGIILSAFFLGMILIGTILLLMPFSRAAGRETDVLTALFTATSAVCVTGLTVVSTHDHWSPIGQGVILLLIQIGALGFVVGVIAIFTLSGRRTSTREHWMFGQRLGVGEPGGLVGLVWRIALFTIFVEAVGAVLLFLRTSGDSVVENAAWWSTFHAVSAFTNAGFDIEPGTSSFSRLIDDPITLGVLTGLPLIGILGFTVIFDVLRRRSWRRLTLESHLVLTAIPSLLVVGASMLFVLVPTFGNTVAADDFGLRISTALSHSVWRTTGFSTVDLGLLPTDTLIVLIILMFIGGASASVAGGITVNSFGALFVAMVSHVRGRTYPEAFGRRVAHGSIMRALAVVGLSSSTVLISTIVMSIAERGSDTVFSNLLFEAVSAFAVVGYSTGITPDLSVVSKLVLIATMFVGRLGVLTLAQSLLTREQHSVVRYPEEAIKVG